ncbi:DUF2170 family protein [Vibrio sp. D431a]|uniref:DUF2170 family protein n=1 Tax=Vibrio sp. D431a TaxID=2837388 RepID=UPI00255457B9|nr:DUF2170 family protein [Vibrio sp. D431a]MDK9789808.1 DUF2170 family protein [Vibrio sp. D431a]
MSNVWNAEKLKEFLSGHNTSVKVVSNDSAILTLHDHNEVEIVLFINDKYMTVQSALFEAGDQEESNFINSLILRNTKRYELSSFALETIRGKDWYVILGQLSASSTKESLLLELNTLADNAVLFIDEMSEAITIFNNAKKEKGEQ